MDYKSSGVDIDAGNETVRRIRQLAKATFTPGVLSDIGSFGGLFKRVVSVTKSEGNLFGSLTFSNRFSNHPYSDFLLGIPTTAARSFQAIGDWPMWRHSTVFITDDFKVSSRLTLNLGARYEYTPGFSSSKGYLASFDIGTGKIVVPDGMIDDVSPAIPRR